jgi:hypothetical protein
MPLLASDRPSRDPETSGLQLAVTRPCLGETPGIHGDDYRIAQPTSGDARHGYAAAMLCPRSVAVRRLVKRTELETVLPPSDWVHLLFSLASYSLAKVSRLTIQLRLF